MLDYKIDGNWVEITCTFSQLIDMDALDYRVWATPSENGDASQLYVATHRYWRNDFIIANLGDFCEAEGWESLGWQEMTQENLDLVANDTTTIRVPRNRDDRA